MYLIFSLDVAFTRVCKKSDLEGLFNTAQLFWLRLCRQRLKDYLSLASQSLPRLCIDHVCWAFQETVHQGLLHGEDNKLPNSIPLVVFVADPRGQKETTANILQGSEGGFSA